MQFDISKVPFSRYGAYIGFSSMPATEKRPAGVYFRNLHGDAGPRDYFLFELLVDGQPVLYETIATPTCLRLVAATGEVTVCISDAKIVRLRCQGVSLRLTYIVAPNVIILKRLEGEWDLNSNATLIQYRFVQLAGQLSVQQKDERGGAVVLLTPSADGAAECAIGEFRSIWIAPESYPAFDDCLAAVDDEYQQWLQTMPETPEALAEAAELAAYINWSAVVAPEGRLKRPGMLMSKNWMTNVWSWDHCFNAMALTHHNPDEAWNQYMVIFDQQTPEGALPDLVNDINQLWNFCKPPVHGWTLHYMMEHSSSVTPERLREIYPKLSLWTEYWFRFKDDDCDGMPQYNHGFDSGWDNSTMFLGGVPIEAPDLSAFLILQMETLAKVAVRLGKDDEAACWQQRAADLLPAMLAHCWRGDRFVAPRSGRHNAFESESLIPFIPIVLGKRLPEEIRAKLINGLKEPGAFLTDYGLATERVDSSFYGDDFYWRGPIWAPPTFIIAQGLAEAGEVEFAREIARRYCNMCTKSGFAENYNARTGAPLRDPAYTWSSSVFLLLAHNFLR